MKTPRSRKDMIAFLAAHFRYSTANSWNGLSSYAANVKLHKLHFPTREVESQAYDLLQCDGVFDEAGVNAILDEFKERHNFEYAIASNGRSGGYMVLYDMERKPDEHKTVCWSCGQKNFEAGTKVCGRCHSNNMHPYNGFVKNLSCRSIDGDRYFEDMDTYSLRLRVKLIMDFDRTVQRACEAFVNYCAHHKVKEVTIRVPKKIMQAVEI